MDGFTAGYYHNQQQDSTDAAPQNHQQYAHIAASQDYQLPNSSAPVSVVSGGQVMDLLQDGVSSYFITPSSRFLEDPDPEEASGYMGKYTCPHLDCPFSNYSYGLNSRAKRNSHMAVCLYGNGVVYQHVPADGQMPSAPYINATVEEFMRGIAARNGNKNNNNPLTVEPAGLAPLSSLNTTITARPPDTQVAPSIYPQSVEPGIQQLELPSQRNAFENNNNNKGVWSTHYSDKQPLEATMMTQGSFQQSALVGNNLDGFNLTGTDKSHQNVTFGMMGAASFSDEDWQLDYPPSTWNF